MEGMDVPPMNPQELIAQYEEIGVTRILVGLDFLTKQNGLKDAGESGQRAAALLTCWLTSPEVLRWL